MSDSISVSFETAQLRALQRFATTAYQTAAKASVTEVTREYEKRLEAATAGAGLGRLAKAWNSAIYPEQGLASAPSGVITPKGKARTKGALLAYTEGARIVGTRGQYLAIPLKAAGPRYYGRGKRPIGPEEWQRRTGLKLELIKVRGSYFLVTAGVVGKKTGYVAKAATKRRLSQGREVETLFIFRLVKQVDVAKRFSVPAVMGSAPGRLAAAFTAKANALLANGGNGGG